MTRRKAADARRAPRARGRLRARRALPRRRRGRRRSASAYGELLGAGARRRGGAPGARPRAGRARRARAPDRARVLRRLLRRRARRPRAGAALPARAPRTARRVPRAHRRDAARLRARGSCSPTAASAASSARSIERAAGGPRLRGRRRARPARARLPSRSRPTTSPSCSSRRARRSRRSPCADAPPGARQRRRDPRRHPRRLARGPGADPRRRELAAALPRHGARRRGASSRSRSPGELVLIPPELFVARPGGLAARDLALRRARRARRRTSPTPSARSAIRDEELAGVDLSSWRIALNGAEPVTPLVLRALRRALRALRPPARGADARLRPRRGEPGGHLQRAPRALPPPRVRPRRAGARRARARRVRGSAPREPRPPAAGLRAADRRRRTATSSAPGTARARPRARALDDAGLPRHARGDRRGARATAGSTPATPASSTTASSTSTGARRTCSSCAGATTRRRTSSTRSTESPGVRTGCSAAVGLLAESGEGEELVVFVERRGAAPATTALAERVRRRVLERTGLAPGAGARARGRDAPAHLERQDPASRDVPRLPGRRAHAHRSASPRSALVREMLRSQLAFAPDGCVRADLVVVGAGPVGLATAIQARLRGLRARRARGPAARRSTRPAARG